MIALLKSGGQLLLTGRPGTGKTEFAYALAAEAGVTLMAAATEEKEAGGFPGFAGRGGTVNRKETVAMASMVVEKSSWLLVDEADTLLSTAGGFLLLFDSNQFKPSSNNSGVIDFGVPPVST